MPVIVLGMHRSGTSALTRLIHALGLDLGRSEDLMSPQADNPLGFWESRTLTRLNDRLLAAVGGRWWHPPRFRAKPWQSDAVRALRDEAAGALNDVYGAGGQWVWKDPRNCLTLSFWLDLLPTPPAIVFIYRHPLEVVTSLGQRNDFPPLMGAGLWEVYNRFAVKQITGLPAFVLSYEHLLDAPLQVLRRLAFFLAEQGIEVDHSPDALAVQQLVAQQLRHHRFGEIDLLSKELNTHQRALYEYLRRLPEQHQRFAADELPPQSPLTYVVLDQYAEADRRVEEAEMQFREAQKKIEEAQRQRDEIAQELRSARTKLMAARTQALQSELDRYQARRELADLQEYYRQRRFRVAERASGWLEHHPTVRRALRLSLGGAAKVARWVRREAVPLPETDSGTGSVGEPTCHVVPADSEPFGADLAPGDRHYRAFVGPPEKYDLVAAMQFNLLTALGLREHQHVLDVGCGSLRAGRLLIPYLLPGHYCGIEPLRWLVEQGIASEVGADLVRVKQPRFDHNGEFRLDVFGRKFDFVIAQSIFSHAASHQISKCLAEVARVIQPAGAFAATYIAGDHNYAGTEWVYPGCVHYTLEHLEALAAEHGLDCQPIDWPHPNGQSWLLFRTAARVQRETRDAQLDPPHQIAPPHHSATRPASHPSPANESE